MSKAANESFRMKKRGKPLVTVKNVLIDGLPVVVVGDKITPHADCESNKRMVQGSMSVFANGKPICRFGDKATCNHQLEGYSSVEAN